MVFQPPKMVATCEACQKEFPTKDENFFICPLCGDLIIPEAIKKGGPELEEDLKLY